MLPGSVLTSVDHGLRWANIQSITSGLLYTRSQLTCPTPRYSVILGFAPSCSIASPIARMFSTVWPRPAPPKNDQPGSDLYLAACSVLAGPQIGTRAANR